MVKGKKGFQRIYDNHVNTNIALPKKALDKANEVRGEKPLARFFGEIVCKELGIDGIKEV